MSSPPTYSANGSLDAYPQPTTRPASVRHRKSSTIIPLSSPADEQPVVSPSTSPARSTAILPEYGFYEPSSPPTPHAAVKITDSHARAHQNGAIPTYMHDMERRNSNASSAAEEGEATPLLGDGEEGKIQVKWYEGPLLVAGVKFSLLFIIFTAILVGTFYFGLPEMDPEDKKDIKLPRSFADLQALNMLFQKYKREYPLRLMLCGVAAYLFVQMFSLPGSMYISILFGAAYGIFTGLLLSCLCDAFGSSLCYALSAIVAPPLLTIPFYRARVETWRIKIMGDPKKGKQVSWGDVFAFLVVLRISPVPPHWVANFLAPHLGIGVPLFWLSCFIGICPISVIHVTIGSSLDTMTSAADFHLISVRNVLGLFAVIVAVLIPVGLKRIFKKDIGDLEEAEAAIEETAVDSAVVDVPAVEGSSRRYQAVDSGVILAGPSRGDDNLDTGARKGKGRALEIIADVENEDNEEEEVFVTDEPVAIVKHEKRLIGYGTIEPVQPETVGRQAGSGWWSFAR